MTTEQQPPSPDQTVAAQRLADALHQLQAQVQQFQQQLAAFQSTLPPRAAEPRVSSDIDTAAPPDTNATSGKPATQPGVTTHTTHGTLIVRTGVQATPTDASDAGDTGMDLVPNGIHAVTGQLLVQMNHAAASRLAHATPDSEHVRSLHKARRRQITHHLGVVSDVDPDKLDESRWAVVVHSHDDAALLKALLPLIQHRCTQQGITLPPLEFRAGETCGAWFAQYMADKTATWTSRPPIMLYQPGETSTGWLGRHGVTHGPVKPSMGVPFYLLIAARPGTPRPNDQAIIPFSFQYELDMFWGVGRLCFTDHQGAHVLADYTAYAEQVVAFEQAIPAYRKHMVFFGTRHQLDTSTQRSDDELIVPLVGQDAAPGIATRNGFVQQVFRQESATCSSLDSILRGQTEHGQPALLFSATHGIGLPYDDERAVMHQGALLCQDWEGFGNIQRDHWFAGEDLSQQAQVTGLVAVCFACYGAGCPQEDQFVFALDSDGSPEPRPQIAPFPLVAQFPQRLLARGTLAVLGHVDRAWTHSFRSKGVPAQAQVFEDVLGRVMAGRRLGYATDQFNMRQGVLATVLANELENARFGKTIATQRLSSLWIARNDARNYALLGDPAVRLPVEHMQE